MTHSIQNTIPQVICLHSAPVIKSALILPSATVVPCFTSTCISFNPSHFQLSAFKRQKLLCPSSDMKERHCWEGRGIKLTRITMMQVKGDFRSWTGNIEFRVQQYLRVFTTLSKGGSLWSLHVEYSEQLGLEQCERMPWYLQDRYILETDAVLCNRWTLDCCCRAGLSVPHAPLPDKHFQRLSDNHCCRCVWNCTLSQTKEDKASKFCAFSVFQQLGQIFLDKLCHSYLTEAASFKLLLPSCTVSKEEVVSKCCTHVLLTFLKNVGRFDFFLICFKGTSLLEGYWILSE